MDQQGLAGMAGLGKAAAGAAEQGGRDAPVAQAARAERVSREERAAVSGQRQMATREGAARGKREREHGSRPRDRSGFFEWWWWFCVRIHVHSGLVRATNVRASPQHGGVCVCEFYVFYLMDLGVRDPVPRVEALGSAAKRC